MNDAQVTTVVKTELSWLKQHETLIVIFLFLLVGVYSINKIINHEAAKDAQAATIAAQQLTEARQEAATAATAFQTALTTAQQANAALVASIAQRQTVLVEQQQAVKTLPLPQVGQDIQTAIGGSGDITAEVDGLKLNDSASRRTLIMLDEVPVLQADKSDLETEVSNGSTALTAAQTLIAAQVKTIAADDLACKDEITAIKAKDRKSRWHTFLWGYGAGLATRGVVKAVTGF